MTDYAKLREEAIALRQQGYSMRQIGERLGLQNGTISRWVRDVPFHGFNAETLSAQADAYRDPHIYARAIELRKQGYSYNLIIDELGVSKSTLSGWLKDVKFAEYHPVVRERMEKAVQAAGRAQTAKAEQTKADAEAEATAEMANFLSADLSERELFVAGLMLYWGEGSKTEYSVGVTNSDPRMIRTFIIWLKLFLNTQQENLRAFVNVYPDVDVDTAETYWSDVTNIPKDQFHKAQVDTRAGKLSNKQGKLKYGTVHVRIVGKGTYFLKLKVLKWIEIFAEHISNAGMA